MNFDKSKIYASLGTAIFCILTFLVLWFVMLPMAKERIEDEGIMVSFGDSFDGMGFGEMQNQVEPKETTVPPQLVEEQQELLTQKQEKTLQLPKQEPRKKDKPKKKQEDLKKQEQERKAAQVAQRVAEEKRKQDEATAKANDLLGGAFGNGGLGSGNTQGDTRQGNPAGSGTSGGHGWSLKGRSLLGSLVTPDYSNNVEGKITVSIRVDANGRVTSASISSPTNISDAQTRNATLSAAKRTRFSSGSGISVGTITYNFKLR